MAQPYLKLSIAKNAILELFQKIDLNQNYLTPILNRHIIIYFCPDEPYKSIYMDYINGDGIVVIKPKQFREMYSRLPKYADYALLLYEDEYMFMDADAINVNTFLNVVNGWLTGLLETNIRSNQNTKIEDIEELKYIKFTDEQKMKLYQLFEILSQPIINELQENYNFLKNLKCIKK